MADVNLSRDIYTTLSERIRRLDYPPGHRLTEEALCAEFGVSRSPVREALGMLAENGLIDKKVRQGYSVRQFDLQEVDDLYDVRLVLELAIIDRVCARGMDPDLLARLEQYWRGLYDGLPDMPDCLLASDEEFHEALARSAGNPVLQQMLEQVDRRIHFARLADITNPDRLKTTCLHHLAILAAVKARDAGQAAAAVRSNIEWGRSNVEAALKDALFRAHKLR